MLLTKQNTKRIKKTDSRNIVTNSRDQREVTNVKSGKGSVAIASLMGFILVFSMVAIIFEFEQQQQALAYGLLKEEASTSSSPSSASDSTEGSSMEGATTNTATPMSLNINEFDGTKHVPTSLIIKLIHINSTTKR